MASSAERGVADGALELALKRDRYIVAAALAAVTALAWVYLLRLAGMAGMAGMDMGSGDVLALATESFRPWTTADFGFTLAMWVVMMIGMMTPSAAPVILLHARVGRQAAAQGTPFAANGWFAAGYLLVWAGFSITATAAQWILERLALLNATMTSASDVFGGIVLIAAGLYQWTSLKYACLSQCQMPLAFIQRHGGFRREAIASLRLGARHGAYCVGCCWALMALLFVGGVMNLLWIAALAVLVLLEKILPTGRLVPRTAGAAFTVAGLWFLVSAFE